MLRPLQNRIKKKKDERTHFLSPQTSNFQAQPVQAFHKRKENLKQKRSSGAFTSNLARAASNLNLVKIEYSISETAEYPGENNTSTGWRGTLTSAEMPRLQHRGSRRGRVLCECAAGRWAQPAWRTADQVPKTARGLSTGNTQAGDMAPWHDSRRQIPGHPSQVTDECLHHAQLWSTPLGLSNKHSLSRWPSRRLKVWYNDFFPLL